MPRSLEHEELSLFNVIYIKYKITLMACEQNGLAVLLVAITENELLEMMRVDGWGRYISNNVVHIGTDFWPLVNRLPSLDSMNDVNTLCMMHHYT